ncbi:MAG TPA: CPBP family intramembrane glutamic endopeptidase [Thermomicrobiaceae bacterium]|nr:CPBP family intramembrane glutamic endopeptidase [Thermomicrobiaceae bacterium]
MARVGLVRWMRRRRLVAFLTLAYGLSWVVWGVALALRLPADHGAGLALLAAGAGGPSVAALLVAAARHGREGIADLLRGLRRWRVGAGWYVVALLGPLLLMAAAVELRLLLPEGRPEPADLSRLRQLIPGAIVILALGGPLQQELGWRGYALPRLQARWSALGSSLILGVVWSLWQLPLCWLPGTPQHALVGSDRLAPLWALGIGGYTVLLSVVITWAFNSTGGSTLLAILLRTGTNAAFASAWLLGLGRDPRTLVLDACLLALVTVVLVVVTSPEKLSRHHRGRAVAIAAPARSHRRDH